MQTYLGQVVCTQAVRVGSQLLENERTFGSQNSERRNERKEHPGANHPQREAVTERDRGLVVTHANPVEPSDRRETSVP